ncbi:hypothetical protein pdam_00021165 [Pocillopora damicornis]|uniref:Fibrinogen C-terminal domain-containing protein n=1 Tax=Pocillopora damicornis TaxID=46731 RepID=A0A3M6U7K5_POCDA|nr:hypothetical protein pdam_00021165 [Pocillopora damicornis]
MDGSIDFNRTWDDPKHGFSNLINCLTRNKTKNKLRVDLGVKTDKTVHPEYGWFGIGTETVKYKRYLGNIINATVSSDSHGPLRHLIFGAWDEVLTDCAQNRGETLKVLFIQISKVFIHFAEKKPWLLSTGET